MSSKGVDVVVCGRDRMMAKSLHVETIEDAVVIRFTRPEIRNPLSINVVEELQRVVNACSADSQIGKVIFTGTGDVFASGADLREIAEVTADAAPEFAMRGQTLMAAISGLPQQTIAAVNGFCFGGALDLALACSKRVASPNAKFAHPGARLGIITGWGGTQRLPRTVGTAVAFEMFYTAEPVEAGRALQIGLIDLVSDDPLAAALAFTPA